MMNDYSKEDLKGLIGVVLQPLHNESDILVIEDVDFIKEKLNLRVNSRKNLTSRTTKVFSKIFEALYTSNFCCIELIYKIDGVALQHTQTIIANLPYINYFNHNGNIYFFFNPTSSRKFGTIEQLDLKEHASAKRAINNSKRIDYIELASLVEKNIKNLKNEIDIIHTLSPGILASTNIKNVLDEFNGILSEISSTKFIAKSYIQLNNLETFDLSKIDMSEIIDMPQITGIDSGDESYSINSDEELTENINTSLRVPNIRRQTPSLALLYDRLLYDEIEIQPEYQRKDRIWSDDKKSKLIESILMQLPLPIFYFGERQDDIWVVIDGLQRLTTVQDFMKNKFALKLDKDSSVYEMNGLTFQEFSRSYTRILREFEITAYVIELQENNDSNRFIIELFHRINTYGVKLSDQEIRSAINFGSSVFYLRYLATSSLFLNATTYTINDKRQKDLELCLGALSYIVYGYKNFNYNRYDSFLASTMQWINKQTFKKIEKNGEVNYQSDSEIITELTSRFEKGLRFSMETFGNDAFKKSINPSNKDPISKPLFESFVSIFSNVSNDEFIKIKENKDKLKTNLHKAIVSDSDEYAKWTSELYSNAERGLNYALSNSTGKRVTIIYRFEALINILENSTGCKINFKPMIGDLNDTNS